MVPVPPYCQRVEKHLGNRQMKKLIRSAVIRIGITSLAFVLLFSFVDISGGLKVLSNANYLSVLGGFAIFVLGQLIAAKRWQWVIHKQGYRLPFIKVLRANMVGSYASMFLPGISGGDIVRPLALQQDGHISRSLLYATIAFERLMGIAVLLTLATTGLLLASRGGNGEIYAISAGIIATGLCGLVLIILLPLEKTRLARTIFGRIHASLTRFINGLRAILRNPAIVLGTLIFSTLFQFCMIGVYLLMLHSIAAAIPAEVILLIPIAWIASAAPISINGMGVREGVLVFILAQNGVDQNAAAAAAVLGVLPMITFAASGGMVFPSILRKIRHRDAPVTKTSQENDISQR